MLGNTLKLFTGWLSYNDTSKKKTYPTDSIQWRLEKKHLIIQKIYHVLMRNYTKQISIKKDTSYKQEPDE